MKNSRVGLEARAKPLYPVVLLKPLRMFCGKRVEISILVISAVADLA